MYYQYLPLYIFFGILPSLIWLNFYLRRDVHPEPKSMVLKIFFYGILSTLPTIFLEMAIFEESAKLNPSSPLVIIFNIFLGVALIEELLKFLVVKEEVLNDPEFDEPIDAMIYMIIAALGFAAGENILTLISLSYTQTKLFFPFNKILGQILGVSLLRFLGATFLHALSSAILGFFLGLSFFQKEKRGKLIFIGLILAILLHGFYNLSIANPDLIYRYFDSIIKIEGNLKILTPFFLLTLSAIFVSSGFKKLKKLTLNY